MNQERLGSRGINASVLFSSNLPIGAADERGEANQQPSLRFRNLHDAGKGAGAVDGVECRLEEAEVRVVIVAIAIEVAMLERVELAHTVEVGICVGNKV